MARFSSKRLAEFRAAKILRIKAGSEPHRFIGIWVVVAANRVFVRSWSRKPRSWFRTFLVDPRGVVQLGNRELKVRGMHTRSERLLDLVDQAYAEKYTTPGAIKFVKGFRSKGRRASTIELVPR